MTCKEFFDGLKWFKIKNKLLCFLGWHGWVWSVNDYGWGNYGNPPSGATCEYCGIKYKEEK